MNYEKQITKPFAKMPTLQLSAYRGGKVTEKFMEKADELKTRNSSNSYNKESNGGAENSGNPRLNINTEQEN